MDSLVYMPVFGSGLGHASRTAVIGKRLQRAGTPVVYSSFWEGARFLQRAGFPCYEVPGLDVSWTDLGSFSLRLTLRRFPVTAFRLASQYKTEIELMSKLAPRIVVSDSSLSALLASKTLGVSCLVLLNQISLRLPTNAGRPFVNFGERVGGELLGRIWAVAEMIMVPDLPPPYTISENSLWGIQSSSHKVKYLGFLVEKHTNSPRSESLRRSFGLDSKPIVFAHISGPAETRPHAVRKVMQAAKILGDKFTIVVSSGAPYGSEEPRRIGNVLFFEWCPFRDEFFLMADMVIARAGHTAISQSILFAKPIIVLPIDQHTEQIGNGAKVEKLGIGLSLDGEKATPEAIAEATVKVNSDDRFRSRVRELALISERLNAVENATSIILSYT